MAIIEARDCEVLVDWMNLEILERVERSDGVLPNIANYIIEISCFEHIDRIRRHPVFHIDISYRLILPVRLVSLENISDSIILILSRKSNLFTSFYTFPFAKGSSFKIVDFGWPVPRHVD